MLYRDLRMDVLTWLIVAGNDASWATPKDQNVFFGDFSVAITENL